MTEDLANQLSEIKERVGAARHESGHALALWWLERTKYAGRKLVAPRISRIAICNGSDPIEGNRSAAGVMTLERQSGSLQVPSEAKDFRRCATMDVVGLMAGPIAEGAIPLPVRSVWEWCRLLGDQCGDVSGSDYWEIVSRIPLLGRRWRLHFERAFDTAEEIVRQHPEHISALFVKLIKAGRVEGEDVYELFDSMGPPVKQAA